MSERSVLLYGATGAVGQQIVRQLVADDYQVLAIYHQNEALAARLGEELGGRVEFQRLDLADAKARATFLQDLRAREAGCPQAFVCAAVQARPQSVLDWDVESYREAMAVNVEAPLATMQALAPAWIEAGGGSAVLLGALDRGQSLPLPISFATSQGALGAMAMAYAKELGGQGLRCNVLALGPLNEGISAQLRAELAEDFETFSALRRRGEPEEIARAALWLLQSDVYLNGKVIPVNGGI